jgi:hypothetical protein
MPTPEQEAARAQAERAIQQGRMFISQTRNKMKQLVDDFAEGKLNREQFHILYERYQSQINSVKLMLDENDPTTWSQALDGDETIALRKKLLGKATGMAIYINKGGTLLNTLGNFNPDGSSIAKLFKKFDEQIAKDKAAIGQNDPDIVPTIQRYHQMLMELPSHGWMFVARARLTTIVTIFTREPTQDQCETMLRLLRDFETANASHLQKENVTATDLAMPFQVFVKREAK